MLSSSILIDYVGVKLIETFRFKDGDVYDYEILLEVFCVFSKYDFTESFILPFFTRKVSPGT